ncbi:trk-type K+ transport systems membrane components [Clostridium sp. CAG:58]|jgi:trk system potassium uptake protein TrkH|uniref:TrkH family potassium uptake protein n=1 Tax=Alitiscatomonas sp. TaxID=2981647 RepID=UPI000340B4A3|nr:TrkH family potassium uptake protein [Clostridium sp. MCC334]CDC46647.1 trk-type K+ transport systems membrane components [Clostridium sp. CAG:58]
MNYSMIFFIIGWVFIIEAALMAPSALVAVLYSERSIWAFAAAIGLCLLLGVPLVRKQPANKVFYAKEGCVTVALSWIVMSLMGALPFVFSGVIPSIVDAMFETVSGFTTTGASILKDVEVLPRCMLFWRSFTHWIGGMGVLVFLLCLLPMSGGGYSMNLMKAESPGPSVSKLVPKVRSTAKLLYGLYVALSLLELALLLLGSMPLFDALCTTFGTAGTGGFGIKNSSIGEYSAYIQSIVTIFMILFGINFNVYFLLYMRKPKEALRCEEAGWYLAIIAVSTLIITVFIRNSFPDLVTAFRHAAFQVGSIITTTGFSTVDFNVWPAVPRAILVLLMFIGACAGSTGGGIKVSRIVLLFRTMTREIGQIIHPHMVKKLKFEGRVVGQEVLRSVNAFMVAYVLIFAVSTLFVCLDGFDLVTSFTAVAATLNNIGPGLEMVGPIGNFSCFSDLSKIVLIFDMLAGRLEIFPLLVLFFRDTWKKF